MKLVWISNFHLDGLKTVGGV